jgi:hypothetical protein
MTFYASFWDAINSLPKKDQLPVFRAVISYGLSGDHSETLSPAQSAFFTLMQPVLDSSRKKAASGKQGGTKPKAERKQSESKPQATPKQNEREKEGEKEKEIEIENECYIGPEIPAVISLPLNDNTEFPVTELMVSEFVPLYPAVDVVQELRKMRAWLLSNPKNRKTRSGIRKFINAWLCREQDKGRKPAAQAPYTHGADRLAAMIGRGDFDD